MCCAHHHKPSRHTGKCLAHGRLSINTGKRMILCKEGKESERREGKEGGMKRGKEWKEEGGKEG